MCIRNNYYYYYYYYLLLLTTTYYDYYYYYLVIVVVVVVAASYTHLRPHETLRYLVCRLLLEKKNLIPPSYSTIPLSISPTAIYFPFHHIPASAVNDH